MLPSCLAFRCSPSPRSGWPSRIGARELAFDEEHIAALLAQHSYRPTPGELTRLHELTCGWAGLVRIAAIHLQAHARDTGTALTSLEQCPRAVTDFLVGELFTALSATEIDFLLAVSLPDAFCLELAGELTGPAAARNLDLLLRTNFPIEATAVDGTLWYSLHPMLLTYLVAEATTRGPDTTAHRHRLCAAWLVRSGRPAEALDHVLAEGDPAHLAEFVRTQGPRMILERRGGPLLCALDRIPDSRDDPFVTMLHIMQAIEHSDTAQAAALREMLCFRRELESNFASVRILSGL